MEGSALICYKTCITEITCVILELDNCLDWNEIITELRTKHHEDSRPLHEIYSSDINRLIKCITLNPFLQDHLTKLNNKETIVLGSVRTKIDDLEAMGQKQFENFLSERLLESKVPISQKIALNKIEI